MCTALVVYEDWHKLQARQQMKMMLRCHGITVSDEQIERLNSWIGSVKEAIRRASDALMELFKKLSEALESTLYCSEAVLRQSVQIGEDELRHTQPR